MLTLNIALQIPTHVVFSVVGEDAFLLNTRTNKYFGLEKVGTRLWELLTEGKLLSEGYQILLSEYEVAPSLLEKDVLELINNLLENGLVEIAKG